ncbi:CHASE2 domain-containing protein [Spirosoma sp. BT702]|uniref:CHASE2 domain-containing protein n=1 Tax=Spirosoma profusum TaxID=2771354 RepID=A0A927ASV9_9BACT|nr:CHASE2 domain-containing protein [Spirosoma profusum]MBD2704488.1 CHASE2 domain-containing protein [Spirosoma profusum]
MIEIWHNILLEAVLFIALSALIFYLLTLIRYRGGKRKRKLFRGLFSFGNALLLTLFTIGCSSNYPLLLEEQVTLFSKLHRFKSYLHWNQSPDVLLGNNRLLLVDVSHDMALIPDPSLNETWKSNQVITDRKKLTQFLQTLEAFSDSSKVDLVVCDLLFPEFSPDSLIDSTLRTALYSLNKKGKLVLAQSGLEENKNLSNTSAIDSDLMAGGSVDITKYYDETYFSYKPVSINKDTSQSQPSLPYVLYKRLKLYPSIPTRKDLISKPPPAFIPDFWIDNEDVSRDPDESVWTRFVNFLRESLPTSTLRKNEAELQEFAYDFRSNLFYLGQVTDTDTSAYNGRKLFLEQLDTNQKEHKKTIVFIGVFEDPNRDIHQTLVGPMHGSILLINLLLNLLAESHQVSLYYFFYLLIGFTIASYLLFPPEQSNSDRKPPEEPDIKPQKRSFRNFWREKLHELAHGIIARRAFIAAFIILLGAITFFNHLINIAIIGLYMLVCNELFTYVFEPKPESTTKSGLKNAILPNKRQ